MAVVINSGGGSNGDENGKCEVVLGHSKKEGFWEEGLRLLGLMGH